MQQAALRLSQEPVRSPRRAAQRQGSRGTRKKAWKSHKLRPGAPGLTRVPRKGGREAEEGARVSGTPVLKL